MAVDATCSDMEALALKLCGAAAAALVTLAPDGPPAWVRQLEEGQVARVSIADLPSVSLESADVDDIDRLVTEHARATGGLVLMGDFPEVLGGPAVGHADMPGFKQRTEIYVNGLEIANMSSTLTDPVLLGAWHEAGLVRKAALGIEPNERDTGLFDAVAKGIPNSAVIGIGIERFLQAYYSLENMSREFYSGY
jgi:hypothetical protein